MSKWAVIYSIVIDCSLIALSGYLAYIGEVAFAVFALIMILLAGLRIGPEREEK